MKYSEAAYILLRILDKVDEYKDSIPADCYNEIVKDCVIFLDKLLETYRDEVD